MAIKVVERKPRKVTCPNCRAKLEYEFEDIQLNKRKDSFGDEYMEEFILCPDCDQHIKL